MFNWKETSGIFEVKVEVMENKTRGSRNNTKSEIIESKSKCPKENWNSIWEKDCPLTANLVTEDKENRQKSSMLVSGKSISFKNIKITKKALRRSYCVLVNNQNLVKLALQKNFRTEQRTFYKKWESKEELATTK